MVNKLRSAKRKIAFALFLSLVLIIIFGFLKPEAIQSRLKDETFWAEKVHSEKKYPIIVFGDSRVYRGVSSHILSANLGGTEVLNFGFSSAGYSDTIFNEIENRLDQNNKTPILILAITPYSLCRKAALNEHYFQEKRRSRDEVFIRRYINPLLSFFEPQTPQAIINKILKKEKGYYHRYEDNGWVASWKIPEDTAEALEPYRKNFIEGDTVEPKIVQLVLNRVKIWNARGIRVFGYRPPTTVSMKTLEDSLSRFKEEEFIAAFEKAGGIWLNFSSGKYHSYDGSHLSKDAAIEFSKELGEKISSYRD